MIKFVAKNVGKRTLELCTSIAKDQKDLTAPLTIYHRIRSNFTIAKTVDEIVSLGYDVELVELIKSECFD